MNTYTGIYIFELAMYRLLIFAILYFPLLSFSQNGVNLFYTASNSALSNSDISSKRIESGSINPASMVNGNGMYVSIGAQRSFLIEDINQGNFIFNYRFKNHHAAGFQMYFYGNQVYSEAISSLAYAVPLKDNTSIGLKLHGIRFSSPENDPSYAYTFTIGAKTMINSQLGIGMSSFNPLGFFREEKSNDLASEFMLGISYYPSDYLGLFVSGTLNDAHPFNFSAGIAYNIKQKLNIYFSAMANPGVIGLGIGIPLGIKFGVDIAGNQHLQLGMSPAFSFSYREL